MTKTLLELPLEIVCPIVNHLNKKDLFSFTLTCTVTVNCVKLERRHLNVRIPAIGTGVFFSNLGVFDKHGSRNFNYKNKINSIISC